MGPRKDEGSYWGYEEQENGQLQSVQNFYLTQTKLQLYVNPLKTKRKLLYLKTQAVPRCKHFSSRL